MQRARRIRVSFRPFALPRAGNIQNGDLVLVHKIGDQVRCILGRKSRRVDQFMRPIEFKAETYCLLGTAAEFPGINDDSSVGVFHVLKRTFAEIAVF